MRNKTNRIVIINKVDIVKHNRTMFEIYTNHFVYKTNITVVNYCALKSYVREKV